jgi:hypothetical protein
LDEQGELGFSAADILSFSTQSTSISWPVSVVEEANGVAPAAASWTLTIEPRSSEARWYVSTLQGQEEGTPGDTCPNFMQVDVRVNAHLQNAQGTWGFAFDSKLQARDAYLAQLDQRITSELWPEMQFVPEEGSTVVGLNIQALLSPGGAAGKIELITESTFVPEGYDPDAKPSGDGPQARPFQMDRSTLHAYFPASNPCGKWTEEWDGPRYEWSLPVSLAQGGVLPDAAVATSWLNFDAELSWEDGSTTTLTSSGLSTETTACLNWWVHNTSPTLRTLLFVPATVHLHTSDGRLDGSYEAKALAYLDSLGQVSDASFSSGQSGIPGSDLASAGISGVVVDPGTLVELDVRLETSAANGPTGMVSVYAPGEPAECNNKGGDPCLVGPEPTLVTIERGRW